MLDPENLCRPIVSNGQDSGETPEIYPGEQVKRVNGAEHISDPFSTADRAADADVSLTTGDGIMQRILVPVDGSGNALAAVRQAAAHDVGDGA